MTGLPGLVVSYVFHRLELHGWVSELALRKESAAAQAAVRGHQDPLPPIRKVRFWYGLFLRMRPYRFLKTGPAYAFALVAMSALGVAFMPDSVPLGLWLHSHFAFGTVTLGLLALTTAAFENWQGYEHAASMRAIAKAIKRTYFRRGPTCIEMSRRDKDRYSNHLNSVLSVLDQEIREIKKFSAENPSGDVVGRGQRISALKKVAGTIRRERDGLGRLHRQSMRSVSTHLNAQLPGLLEMLRERLASMLEQPRDNLAASIMLIGARDEAKGGPFLYIAYGTKNVQRFVEQAPGLSNSDAHVCDRCVDGLYLCDRDVLHPSNNPDQKPFICEPFASDPKRMGVAGLAARTGHLTHGDAKFPWFRDYSVVLPGHALNHSAVVAVPMVAPTDSLTGREFIGVLSFSVSASEALRIALLRQYHNPGKKHDADTGMWDFELTEQAGFESSLLYGVANVTSKLLDDARLVLPLRTLSYPSMSRDEKTARKRRLQNGILKIEKCASIATQSETTLWHSELVRDYWCDASELRRATDVDAAKQATKHVRTVLEVDLVGYSTLARTLHDSVGPEAVNMLNSEIKSLIESAKSNSSSTALTVASTGDGAIVFFESPDEAVECGKLLHASCASRNSSKVDESAKLWFRCGIATGEVYVNHGPNGIEIAGATIADAVRLEAAGKPGEIVVDAKTYDALSPAEQTGFGAPETVKGKRTERFEARRYRAVDVAGVAKPEVPASQPKTDRRKLITALQMLVPGDRLELLIVLIEMPFTQRPSRDLTLADRQAQILQWANAQGEKGLQRLADELEFLLVSDQK